MTVCIAATAIDNHIVTATDHMLSMASGTFTAEAAALKIHNVGIGWSAMFAGDDITTVPGLVRRIQQQLDGYVEQHQQWIPVDVLKRTLATSFQIERRERAADQFVSPYGVSLDQFFAHGDAALRDTEAALLRERIVNAALECELLVLGFEGPLDQPLRAMPHVMVVSDPGVVREYDEPGYWAIGSGAYAALSALAARRQSRLRILSDTVYHVCEAKFAAECALGVWRETYVTIHAPGRWMALYDEQVMAIRKEWERVGRPRQPDQIVPQIAGWTDRDSPHWMLEGPTSNRAGQQSPEPSTRDPKDQPPSQE